MKKILVVDNQDSFVYNLVEMLRQKGVSYDVVKSNAIVFPLDLNKIAGVLLSPGGDTPDKYPQMMKLIKDYHHRLPILGICLGHQALAQHFNSQLTQLPRPLHGHASRLTLLNMNDLIIEGVSQNAVIGRYHSWVVSKKDLSPCLLPIAIDEDNNWMIIKHRDYPVWGVQFHPESIITDACGKKIVDNWLKYCYR